MFIIKNMESADLAAPQKGHRVKQVSWGLLLTLSVLIYGSHAPLITLCKVDNKIPFSSSSCVVLIELAKFIVSLGLLFLRDRHSLHIAVSWKHVVPYAVPALLYAVNNNLVVFMQVHMDPSTFQVLSNLKIASTALLYSAALRKHLNCRQWLSLALLMAAGICHTYSSMGTPKQKVDEAIPGTQFHITALGLLLLLVYCIVSGLAAVYTELILKTQRLPLNLQNLFLYFFGIVVNSGAHLASAEVSSGFFDGYSRWVGVIVVTQALNGLLMSVVMKHSNNITRLFLISCSMLVNAVYSVALFNLQLTPLFFVSVFFIALAIHLYYHV
ncbi:putative UDP-sugar transporter protein SLC35A4 [Acipenser oxyrinchus oxyrinchus]|uniref:UDP-sugar transporter protein SLC35A4 n=1 Tax=Acipenser oxyrinchus oxyrinchus TaxID=40147 RepID=A0AAD8FXN6_ACIOX|nr:putative UDP-sugar transporter protein SLC35A4 [Acipenser oxyrinchus oxyrinchus]